MGLDMPKTLLDHRSSTVKRTFSLEQCKAMMAQMSRADRLLFCSLLIIGSDARTMTWAGMMERQLDIPIALLSMFFEHIHKSGYSTLPMNCYGLGFHWIDNASLNDAIFTAKSGLTLSMNSQTKEITRTKAASAQPFTTHEVTRRIKRYAKRAGLNAEQISLRTVLHTHKFLTELYSDADELAEALGLKSFPQTQVPAERPVPGSRSQRPEWSLAGGTFNDTGESAGPAPAWDWAEK